MKRHWQAEDDVILDDLLVQNLESLRRRDAHSQVSVGHAFPEWQIPTYLLWHENLNCRFSLRFETILL